jgi:hypothetical protein
LTKPNGSGTHQQSASSFETIGYVQQRRTLILEPELIMTPTWRNSVAALSVCLIMGAPIEAMAGDYSNECKSSDGAYVILDGVLEKEGDSAGTSRPYRIIEDQILSETEGYCLSDNPEAKSAKFGYLSRTWRQTIVIENEGSKALTVKMSCDLAASGLPAAFNCDRDTVTKSEKSPRPLQSWQVGAPGTWSHNGSAMKLEADGENRRFIYMNPRAGLLAVGIRPDAALFEGTRSGNTYSGTARYWSKQCGVQTFAVTGTVSADERTVTLSGEAPKLDASCTVTGRSSQTLVFDRH